MRTTITPPPNGPRNPPRYSAARARRSRPRAGRSREVGTFGRHGRRTGSQTSGARRRSATVQAARPALEARDVLVGHPGRRVGRDEQRRRIAGRPPRRGTMRRTRRRSTPPDGHPHDDRRRRASSERSRVGAEKVRNGGRTGRRSAGTRWSEALSSQPLHHTRSKIRVSARRCPDAVAEIRWSTPSTPIQVPGGGAVGSNPNSEITPSMSTNSSGLSPECAGSGMGVPVRRRLFRNPSLACRDRARVKTRPRGADDGGEGRRRNSDPTRALTPSS